jgi:hypothetical protein
MILELTQKEVTAAIAEYVGNELMRKQGVRGYTEVVKEGQVQSEPTQRITVTLLYDSSKDEGARVSAKVEL